MHIISGCNKNRFNCFDNHQQYCDFNNYTYKYYNNIKTKDNYMIKILALLDALQTHDYVMWMDDDAFFVDKNWKADGVFKKYNESFIVSKSPFLKSFKKVPPLFNSGVMFFRNTSTSIDILNSVLNVEVKDVKDNWLTKYGNSVGGDQDKLIYITQTMFEKDTTIVECQEFNSRWYHYENDFPPIVHFAGKGKQKMDWFIKNVKDIYDL